jgi:alpha-amylase
MKKYFVAIVLCLLSFNSVMAQPKTNNQGPKPGSPPKKRITWPDCIHYEIFLRSFADSNKDGIGDLQGAVAKLDEVEQLGAQGIWLMPIHPSPSYHKYDVTDYYAIDPEYGTIKDFIYFLDEAHKREIKVIIDLVLNHCSSKHPWFMDAANNPKSQYRDYFVWSDTNRIKFEPEHWYFPKRNNGKAIRGQKYYGYFSDEMPDWNYDNPKVREEMIKIATFWLGEIGVDGFRLDAAQHIYPEHEKNVLWWNEFGTALRKINPEFFMVGEVTNDFKVVNSYITQPGLHSLFNFDLANAIVNTIVKGQPDKSFDNYFSAYTSQKSTKKFMLDATFITNHDQNRIMSEVAGNADKAKLAASILMTLPGAPFIYYGEEIGLQGKKPDPNIREPMLWDESENDTMRTSWIKPEHALEKNTTPLAQQKQDRNSLYRHYRRMINYRSHSKVLQYGGIEKSNIQEDGVLSFYRTYNKERFLVVHNLKPEAKTFQLTGLDSLMIVPIIQNEKTSKVENNNLTIAPYGTLVLMQKRMQKQDLINRKEEK